MIREGEIEEIQVGTGQSGQMVLTRCSKGLLLLIPVNSSLYYGRGILSSPHHKSPYLIFKQPSETSPFYIKGDRHGVICPRSLSECYCQHLNQGHLAVLFSKEPQPAEIQVQRISISQPSGHGIAFPILGGGKKTGAGC